MVFPLGKFLIYIYFLKRLNKAFTNEGLTSIRLYMSKHVTIMDTSTMHNHGMTVPVGTRSLPDS